MKSTCLILLLAGSTLLASPARLLAKEQPKLEKPETSQVEKTISAEDLKVIAHMDLLQQIDMLKDFKILSVGEKKP